MVKNNSVSECCVQMNQTESQTVSDHFENPLDRLDQVIYWRIVLILKHNIAEIFWFTVKNTVKYG